MPENLQSTFNGLLAAIGAAAGAGAFVALLWPKRARLAVVVAIVVLVAALGGIKLAAEAEAANG